MSESITNRGDLHLAQERLDALSSEECDEEEFLRAVQGLICKDQDSGWDLLSLLDQYYRRGKIKPEVFRIVKLNLEGLLLGTADAEDSLPVAQTQDPSTAAGLTAPIAASARIEARPTTPVARTTDAANLAGNVTSRFAVRAA